MSQANFKLTRDKESRDVVCFADVAYTPTAVEIVGPRMPETWRDGYRWQDLNIMPEAYVMDGVPDLVALRTFILACVDIRSDKKLFMHVWESNLQ